MYSNLIRDAVNISIATIAIAVELVQIPGFQTLPDAMVDTHAFIADMEENLHN